MTKNLPQGGFRVPLMPFRQTCFSLLSDFFV